MNVIASTFPRSSLRATRWPSCVVRVNSAAGPIRGRPSFIAAARASAGGRGPMATKPIRIRASLHPRMFLPWTREGVNSRPIPRPISWCKAGVHPRPRSPLVPAFRAARGKPLPYIRTGSINPSPRLPLQLLLQLVEKAPVGALGDDLLRAALDHPGLVQAEGVEAHRILGLVFPPIAVGDFSHGLESIVL